MQSESLNHNIQKFPTENDKRNVVLEFSTRCPEFHAILARQFPPDWICSEFDEKSSFERKKRNSRSSICDLKRLRSVYLYCLTFVYENSNSIYTFLSNVCKLNSIFYSS